MVFSKTTLFLFFHRHQTAKTNKILQGTDVLCLIVLKQFILCQVSKSSLKEVMCEAGTPTGPEQLHTLEEGEQWFPHAEYTMDNSYHNLCL